MVFSFAERSVSQKLCAEGEIEYKDSETTSLGDKGSMSGREGEVVCNDGVSAMAVFGPVWEDPEQG